LGQGKEPEPVWKSSNKNEYKDLSHVINPNNKYDYSAISVTKVNYALGQDKMTYNTEKDN